MVENLKYTEIFNVFVEPITQNILSLYIYKAIIVMCIDLNIVCILHTVNSRLISAGSGSTETADNEESMSLTLVLIDRGSPKIAMKLVNQNFRISMLFLVCNVTYTAIIVYNITNM